MDAILRSTSQADHLGSPEPMLYRISDVMRILNMSRTVVFDQLRTGRLRSVKQGRTRLVPVTAVREYVALLEREAEAA